MSRHRKEHYEPEGLQYGLGVTFIDDNSVNIRTALGEKLHSSSLSCLSG